MRGGSIHFLCISAFFTSVSIGPKLTAASRIGAPAEIQASYGPHRDDEELPDPTEVDHEYLASTLYESVEDKDLDAAWWEESTLKKFLEWPFHPDEDYEAWPLLSQRRSNHKTNQVLKISVPRSLGSATQSQDAAHSAAESHENDAHSMVVHVTYEDIYAILVFLVCATALGIVTKQLGMPALVGEITVGFLLGPPLANFVPFPQAMVLVGEIGLIMLLLEAGVEIDIAQLKETGARALGIAATGSALPLLLGMGLAMGTGASVKTALAVGASFSPTSLGVAANALSSGGMLNTPVGQLIVASCVFDDIIALILLSMFEVLVKPNPAIWEYFVPIISAVGFLIVLGLSAVTWMPNVIENKILKRCKKKHKELVMFSLMTILLMAYLPLLYYTKASYLTGAFLAGMTFSQIESAHHAFIEKTHQLMTWLLRIFFAASIGFQVPVKLFGDPYVIGWGFAFYLAVAIKAPLGLAVPKFQDVKKGASFNPFLRDRMVTGLAMSCRGEFSFIIAAFGLGEGLFDAKIYAAIVWAVLLSCVTSPFMLLHTIKYFKKRQLVYLAQTNPLKSTNKASDGKMALCLHIQTKSAVQWGQQQKFRSVLNDLGFEIMDHRTDHQRGLNAQVQTDIYVQDTNMRINIRKIQDERKAKKAIRASCRNLAELGKISSFSGGVNSRVSSENLKDLDLSVLPAEGRKDIESRAEEGDLIIARCREVRNAILNCIGLDDATAEVAPWNPWDWSTALDIMSIHHGAEKLSVDFFMDLFDKVDTDGSGSIDKDELYEALKEAGAKISQDGLDAMVAMMDEDGDGEVDRREWKEAIDFYIESQLESMGMMPANAKPAMPDRRVSRQALLSTPMEEDEDKFEAEEREQDKKTPTASMMGESSQTLASDGDVGMFLDDDEEQGNVAEEKEVDKKKIFLPKFTKASSSSPKSKMSRGWSNEDLANMR